MQNTRLFGARYFGACLFDPSETQLLCVRYEFHLSEKHGPVILPWARGNTRGGTCASGQLIYQVQPS